VTDTAPAPTDRRARRLATWESRTQRSLDLLAIVFLAALFIRWLLDGRPAEAWFRNLSTYLGYAVWVAFAIDYLVRLRLSVPRREFVRTHKLDLLMVLLPFLRILRVGIIIVKSVRQISTQRIAASMVGIAIAVVGVGALVVWRYETVAPDGNIHTVGDAIWWAIVTTTTVGYGNEYPVTLPGQIVATGIMIIGIGLIGTVSASVASWFVARRNDAVAAETAAGGGDGRSLHERLEELAAEQRRIRELLERLAPEDRSST
jgi:voltage-gated potassium channel